VRRPVGATIGRLPLTSYVGMAGEVPITAVDTATTASRPDSSWVFRHCAGVIPM